MWASTIPSASKILTVRELVRAPAASPDDVLLHGYARKETPAPTVTSAKVPFLITARRACQVLGVVFVLVFANRANTNAAPQAPIAFVPLDDRPVTLQLPVMLGAIAGTPVVTPPVAMLGNYLRPGDPEGILTWLGSPATSGVGAVVASTDMVEYGGLVASRAPYVAQALAEERLRRLAALKAQHPGAFVGVFGTIMRLAPTGVPPVESASEYWATGATVTLIQQFANLPVPLRTPEQRAYAARLRVRIGGALGVYFATRARDLYLDEDALGLTAGGAFDRIAIGQDDAGPVGAHVRDVAALLEETRRFALGMRATIEPGADELGMVMIARALALRTRWTPRVHVVYSRAGAQAVVDPLEFVPIDTTISRIIQACGAQRVVESPEITFFVKVAQTSDADERAFEEGLSAWVRAGHGAAVVDLTFLHGEPGVEQRELTEALIAGGIAGRVDGFGSWNTDANSVGTALSAAIAAAVGRRTGGYDARAHAQFLLDRYADDYAFHQFVRPVLNGELRAKGIDPDLLLPPIAQAVGDENRALLWPYALDLLAAIFPQYRDAGLTITLPWDRTFEAELSPRLEARSSP